MFSSILSSSSSITSAASAFSRPLLLLVFAAAALAPYTLGARGQHDEEPALQPDAVVTSVKDATKSVTMLNRFTFDNTVQQEHVDHWVVLFCVDWYQVCQGLQNGYRATAQHWEQALSYNATSWQKSAVRFAEVDCATDKALCNENNVQSYPTVLHFKGGKLVKNWELTQSASETGMQAVRTALSSWIAKELTGKLTNGQWSQQAPKKQATRDLSQVIAGVRELGRMMSWKALWEDPVTAVVGYFILAAAIVLFAWIVGTGLEIELKATLSGFYDQAKNKNGPSALLPNLPELPASRTIVRKPIEL